ncbi:MAG: capsular polysaccharide synthesis protein [Lachnospiraceae bacterium]
MGLKAVFQKQGGMNLIKQYLRSGVFFTAISQFILLGKSRTALEILRLSVELKAKQKLQKQFKKSLEEFANQYDETLPHEKSNKVFICWFQGIENAPAIVKKCYASIKENLTDREIILIDKNNMLDYVSFPDYIIEKWEKGIISNTHFSDLLRLELLIKYGGLWIDATVFCTAKREDIPDFYFDSDLFLFQCLKPGRDGHSGIASNWFICAKSNNKILMATKHLCYAYWKKYNYLIDYFFSEFFMDMVLEYYSEDWLHIVPKDNATPHILLLRMFEKYDEAMWQEIKKQTPFHKLSYKYTEEQSSLKGTYFQQLFQ